MGTLVVPILQTIQPLHKWLIFRISCSNQSNFFLQFMLTSETRQPTRRHFLSLSQHLQAQPDLGKLKCLKLLAAIQTGLNTFHKNRSTYEKHLKWGNRKTQIWTILIGPLCAGFHVLLCIPVHWHTFTHSISPTFIQILLFFYVKMNLTFSIFVHLNFDDRRTLAGLPDS